MLRPYNHLAQQEGIWPIRRLLDTRSCTLTCKCDFGSCFKPLRTTRQWWIEPNKSKRRMNGRRPSFVRCLEDTRMILAVLRDEPRTGWTKKIRQLTLLAALKG